MPVAVGDGGIDGGADGGTEARVCDLATNTVREAEGHVRGARRAMRDGPRQLRRLPRLPRHEPEGMPRRPGVQSGHEYVPGLRVGDVRRSRVRVRLRVARLRPGHREQLHRLRRLPAGRRRGSPRLQRGLPQLRAELQAGVGGGHLRGREGEERRQLRLHLGRLRRHRRLRQRPGLRVRQRPELRRARDREPLRSATRRPTSAWRSGAMCGDITSSCTGLKIHCGDCATESGLQSQRRVRAAVHGDDLRGLSAGPVRHVHRRLREHDHVRHLPRRRLRPDDEHLLPGQAVRRRLRRRSAEPRCPTAADRTPTRAPARPASAPPTAAPRRLRRPVRRAQCCVPHPLTYYSGQNQCGTNLPDGCGHTITVTCAAGLECVANATGSPGPAPASGVVGTCCTRTDSCNLARGHVRHHPGLVSPRGHDLHLQQVHDRHVVHGQRVLHSRARLHRRRR